MAKFQLTLLIHAHQPVGNFDDVIERAYQHSYLPFVETLARHPSIHMGLHYSGVLLGWLERAHPEYFELLRTLVKRGQIEIVGGGFYEPILVVIPPEDCFQQITRLSDYIEKHLGQRPKGAWLAERVWEPQLPSSLAAAGVEYTLVDDNHFLGAGFELDQLFGYYTAEDRRRSVKVLPGLKALRYLIPFRGAEETSQFLRSAAGEHPGSFAAMGDDMEKFGVWPGTYEHCYRDHWLENFFTDLERNSDWLETSTPIDAVSSHGSLGRADLPTASYTEMMEWSLPTPARNRYHALTVEFANRPAELPFLRGGIWRNFFSKYCESNLLHKKMQHVSAKVRHLEQSRRPDKAFRAAREQAKTLVLQSQCNDAYWHGVFGGLYSPHLRTALWRSLVQAESSADALAHRGRSYATVESIDFNADGREEVYFCSDRYSALLSPDDGATISALDCRRSNAALINSLCRRPESYHAALKNLSAKKAAGVQSIHEQTRTKEAGLERFLQYDRWPQNAFRLKLFGRGKNYEDCATVRLEENAGLAGGRYRATDVSPTRATFVAEESNDWPAEKTFSFSALPQGFEIICDVALQRTAPGAASMFVGLEVVINFLAPSAPDRYFETHGQRYPLRWGASTPASKLRMVDEWQGVSVTLGAPNAQDFWVTPIESVSESEEGFERIYQGSQVMAVWPIELAPGAKWTGRLGLKVEQLAQEKKTE
ncbi:MAG: alpha-amylase/4-alpha-glucanotransferase domain-containing protein [Candidatus Acidiferrales bacterium]